MSDRQFRVLAAAGVATGLVAALFGPRIGEYLARIDQNSRWAVELFGGQDAAAAVFSNILVFCGVGLTGLLLIVWAGRRRGAVVLMRQFEEGAGLLKSDLEVAQVSGSVLLGALALRFPERYLAPVVEALAAHLHEATLKDVVRHHEASARAQPQDTSGFAHSQTGDGALHALSMLGGLRTGRAIGQPWAFPVRPAQTPGRLTIAAAYFGNVGLAGADFSHTDFRTLIAWRLRFIDCDLTNATIEVALDDLLAFENCILNGVTLAVTDWRGNPPGQVDSTTKIVTQSCTVDSHSTLNGTLLNSTGAY